MSLSSPEQAAWRNVETAYIATDITTDEMLSSLLMGWSEKPAGSESDGNMLNALDFLELKYPEVAEETRINAIIKFMFPDKK